MKQDFLIKTAFFKYELIWKMVMPFLRLNSRLADGYDQRTLKKDIPSKADIWIQAASAGEAYLAEEIVNRFESEKPLSILLTSGTRQGVDILSRTVNALSGKNNISFRVSFFPFDSPSIMEKAVKNINPKVMVLLESEMWPGHLLALKKYGCKTVVINGRMTEKSLKKYLAWKSFWNSIKPDVICAISEEDAGRFGKLFGSDNIKVMPNIKFDRFGKEDAANGIADQVGKILGKDSSFIVLGSVREEEEPLVEKVILDILKRKPKTIIGLFPRHLNRTERWSDALTLMNIRWALKSGMAEPAKKGSVILWDTFGELANAYRHADAAFLGGSLAPLGGQNFLEALNCGVIPVTGPFWNNFSWVGHGILDEGLLRTAKDWQGVSDAIVEIAEKPPSREKVISDAGKYIKSRQGGTVFACHVIKNLLEE
ncbi:MAG: 3-deoxy-D-manno-octulosonic acid transferase [Desulfobacteraceae bacterium]|nr:MAG: 3-deoxy-D-manno-octulosonic acid transferase [Desulfobacteraceae bacterium]